MHSQAAPCTALAPARSVTSRQRLGSATEQVGDVVGEVFVFSEMAGGEVFLKGAVWEGIDLYPPRLQQAGPIPQVLDQPRRAHVRILLQVHQLLDQFALRDIRCANQGGLVAVRFKRQAIERLTHGLLIDAHPFDQAGLDDFVCAIVPALDFLALPLVQ